LSISSKCPDDRAIAQLREAAKAAIRDAFGYGDTNPMKGAGNFGEGEEFVRVGGRLRWTTYTQAQINDWNEQGRCVGWVNLELFGSSGIGRLPPDQALSLFSSLVEIGFTVVRRIDSTIDLFDHPTLSVDLIRRKFEKGVWKIPRRDPLTYFLHGPILQPDHGTLEGSLYLGPSSAPSRVTIYNKGAQKGSERPWIRFELRSRREHASELWERLVALSGSIFEGGHVFELANDAITAAVRSSADIFDISAFNDIKNLPKNWTRSPMAKLPDELHPVFAAVAPMDLGDLKIRGGYASAVRHHIRSSSKAIWKMCLVMAAHGDDPGKAALLLGIQSAMRLSKEDFEEMARDTNTAPADLEKAELTCLSLAARYEGFDIDVTSSDKTELRAAVAATVGGVV
jgi:hypothetical protein